ncbi:hypothetical protein PSTT_09497 [Puccinia striiformis]|uniref:Uncharacterized protein n=1 Tax=Puccinia striiformis TaxID=27350 RepID=A0A2S4V8A2_9BASI|nr:hypothetical protein PSTT_09497 [Puccinia striiformis]
MGAHCTQQVTLKTVLVCPHQAPLICAPPSTAGKPIHPPAGCPSYCSSTVAGVQEYQSHPTFDLATVDTVRVVGLEFPEDEDDSNLYPQLSSAAISTYQELDAFNASPDDSKPTSENENLTGLASLSFAENTLDDITS